jgi:hypothetical protein
MRDGTASGGLNPSNPNPTVNPNIIAIPVLSRSRTNMNSHFSEPSLDYLVLRSRGSPGRRSAGSAYIAASGCNTIEAGFVTSGSAAVAAYAHPSGRSLHKPTRWHAGMS